jgi:ATPase family associated with various cellular activities (AAA)
MLSMADEIRLNPEQLLELMDAALAADHARLKRIGSQLVRTVSEQGNETLAKQLHAFIRRRGVPIQASGIPSLPVDSVSRLPLIDEEPWPQKPVILNEETRTAIERFLADVQNAEKLAANGLLTRFGLMLAGPPGTGKTLLAGHIAAQLNRPFFVARLDSLISSRLGETAKNIRMVFDFAPAAGGVLFLDELDAIAKMRDDRHELGELKRVVNTVIQGLDSLDDRAIVIAATNHAQLLDPAIWRRFPYRSDIGLPDDGARSELWLQFLYQGNRENDSKASVLGRMSAGLSGADIENLALATRRSAVLGDIEISESQLLWSVAQSHPPNIVLPSAGPLSTQQIKTIVYAAMPLKGQSVTAMASMLGLSPQIIYRYMKDEERHE